MLQEQLRKVGVVLDITALDPAGVIKGILSGAYDAVYFGTEQSSTDPANNLDFWISSGGFHVWHLGQKAAATEWEALIDDLMRQQMATTNLAERQRLFAEAQRARREHPRDLRRGAAHHRSQEPQAAEHHAGAAQAPVLWNADILAVRSGRRELAAWRAR